MENKKKEFRNLTQDRKTVDEYSREFTCLARYAGDVVSTDPRKQTRFRQGLNPSIKHVPSLTDFLDF